MLVLYLTILDGAFGGQTVTDRLVLTEPSPFRVVWFLRAIGWPVPRPRIERDASQFVGRVLDVTIGDSEPYNGRIRSHVHAYGRVTDPSPV